MIDRRMGQLACCMVAYLDAGTVMGREKNCGCMCVCLGGGGEVVLAGNPEVLT